MQPSAAKPALADIAEHVTIDRVKVFACGLWGVAKENLLIQVRACVSDQGPTTGRSNDRGTKNAPNQDPCVPDALVR